MNELSNSPAQTAGQVSFANRRAWYPLLIAAAVLLLLFLTVGEMAVGAWEQPGQGPDLGDAPDSTNHHNNMTNTAYLPPMVPITVPGRFPTVWEGPSPSGPRHLDVSQVWLGEWASVEEEADTGPDQDTINNILHQRLPNPDNSDNDLGDDGWLNPKVPLGNCRRAVLKVLVSQSRAPTEKPLYLNVWFDGNRDGDWDDVGTCGQEWVSFEWIVQNFVIDSTVIPPGGSHVFFVPTVLVRNDAPGEPAWVRFTLSEQEHPLVPGSNLADGRGPSHPDNYMLGETEDYLVEGFPGGEPEITLTKHIVSHNGELQNVWHVLPGHEVVYQLVLNSTSNVTHTVHISDDLPPGLVGLAAMADSGVAQIVNGGHTAVWDGELGPANRPVTIHIRARLTRRARCGDEFGNQAFWYTPFGAGWSNEVVVVLRCHDLGDAPDSTNHYGVNMTAYPGVPAKFPTVYAVAAPQHGPLHRRPRPLHLGRYVSAEFEADVGPDMDGPNNIDPPNDVANLDRGDDGLELDKMNFAHCQYHRFPVWIRVDPIVLPMLEQQDGIAYLNVWLDGNHNGDWADPHQCPQAAAPEHIVIDRAVNVFALGPGLHRIWVTTSGPVFWPPAMGPAWLRVTLSKEKSVKLVGQPYGDGRGPALGFALGETEDYLLRPPDDLRPDLGVKKHVFLYPRFEYIPTGEWKEVWAVGWVVDYANVGAAPAPNVQIVDTYDTGGIAPLWPPTVHSFPPIPYIASPPQFTFNAGTLLPGQGGHIVIRALLPFSAPPATVLTNTVTITSPGDVNPGNNRAVVSATIPFLPPRILFPRPGTTCTGTFTITGRVQPFYATPPITVEVFIDGTLHETVAASNDGRWSSKVTGLPDGDHEIYAVAHYKGLTSPESRHVKITVDSGLSWSPITLRFIDQDGHVLLPGDQYGRMDATGWRVFLRAGRTYTVVVYLCCVDPGAQVTLEVDGLPPVSLQDLDGDHWYEGTFTAPTPLSGSIELCVTCNLVRICSDGEILIDPEGTVYDLSTGLELENATVTCYEAQSDEGGGTYYGLWPADEFEQDNPQTTGADGYYSFFTPPGTYRVGVTKDEYQGHLSGDLVVADGPVHYDVYLAPVVTQTADYTITIGSLGFDPPVLVASPGSIIAWVNVDSEHHASTSVTPTLQGGVFAVAGLSSDGGWDSGLLETGQSYKQQLDTVGTYTYRDGENAIHTGQILVRHMIYLPVVLRQYP